MMGASNLMMGLTLVLVICLAVVLGLVLVLLAELYCTALLRRRNTTATAAGESLIAVNNPLQPSIANFYTQSILTAPRSILYPSVTSTGAGADIEKPPENQESVENNGNSCRREEGLVYISNPMFDDENGRRSKVAAATGNTPFETPDTSPSRLETEDDDDEDEVGEEMTSVKVVVVTPPLTPMKKLPETVEGGGGDMNSGSNNGGGGVSSSASSSGTPCTSLSW
uniref:uncharacterized protein LOC122599472 n=1 Tax=Erigeron canadensis TaxID=72917 RepID=UPI001CB8ACE4|nr:uncharacterized protein LOC122599472 [Erigeron canadensis]